MVGGHRDHHAGEQVGLSGNLETPPDKSDADGGRGRDDMLPALVRRLVEAVDQHDAALAVAERIGERRHARADEIRRHHRDGSKENSKRCDSRRRQVAERDFSGDEVERPEKDDEEHGGRDGGTPRAAGVVRCFRSFAHDARLRRAFPCEW